MAHAEALERVTETGIDTQAGVGKASPLQLRDIRFAIDGQRILNGISLDVSAREIVCLLGPSGCGKTTLLRIAAGIERQNAGEVRVGGRTVAGPDVFVPAEARRIGYVFQDLALFPHMRIIDNVVYGRGSLSRAEAQRAGREALAQVGLGGYERAFPHQLSGGQQQRVALTRALLPAPQVVLFDEPFSGLDRGLRDTVREDTLSLLKAREATAVIVTHDPEEALALSDRIALMRDGRIVQIGTPEEIWRWPADLEAARVFSTLNVFRGRVSEGRVETPVGSVAVGRREDGEALTIAFRPEAFTVLPADRAAGAEVRVERRRFFGTYVEIAGTLDGAPLVLRAAPYQVPRAESVRVVPDLRQAIVLPGEQ